MCLGIPSKVISIENTTAIVDVLGARRSASLLLLEGGVNIGDYVLIHAGFAIQKLQEDVAHETIGYFKQIIEAEEAAEEAAESQPI